MILVECTLNFNHVKGVLGPGGRIYFPSQLIPMIIGSFSFVRLIYKMLGEWRGPDVEPSLPEDSPIPATQQEFPGLGHIKKVFAPPTGADRPPLSSSQDMPPEDNDLDEVLVGRRPSLRYLISWLPWLSLLDRFRNGSAVRKNVHERGQNLERGQSSPSSTLRGSMSWPASSTKAQKPQ